MKAPPVAVPLATTTAVNYRHTCPTCGAVTVARYPGDLILAMDRNGWIDGQCRGCKGRS